MEATTFTNFDILNTQVVGYERYLRLPYRFLTENLNNKTEELTTFEAFIQLLANVRYEDISELKGEKSRICHRGESYKSLQAWGIMFHWNKFKTRRFFIKLMNCGIIELESDCNTTRVKILNYDKYVGYKTPVNTDSYSPNFESFWKSYHDITRLPATDKIAAFKLWTKLTASEHEKAQAKIGRYYYSLSKTTYCVKALTYLKNKKFNDQYYY